MLNGTSIKRVRGIQIFDSRGNPTLRAFVETDLGIVGKADAPAGKSKGSKEAKEVRDRDGRGVKEAVKVVNNYINHSLKGLEVTAQEKIDKILEDMDGTHDFSRIGGNSAIATSLACIDAGSKVLGVEPFMYIGGVRVSSIPVPLMNVINGGAHAGNSLRIQEFIMIPHGFDTISEALYASSLVYSRLKEIIKEKYGSIYTAVGDEGGFSPPARTTEEALEMVDRAINTAGYSGSFSLGLDAASNEFYDQNSGKYLIDNKELTRDQLIEYYKLLGDKFNILYLEDPFVESDYEGFSLLRRELKNTIVTGDDLFATNTKHLAQGIEKDSANGIIIKPNQAGTFSRTVSVVNMAMKNSIKVVVSHRSGDTESGMLADLSVGLGADLIKTGAPARSERLAKYNRLIEIEEIYGLKYLGERIKKV